MFIKIPICCQELKGCHLQFPEVMSLYYGKGSMQIERCREDYYDLSNQQAAGEQLSKNILK